MRPRAWVCRLPYDVVSSEFLTMEGSKFSASRNVAVWLPDYFSRYDADPLRYFLMINGPESADTDFTWAEFLRRNNDELVATWGNLAHRVLSFTYKNFQAVPAAGRAGRGGSRRCWRRPRRPSRPWAGTWRPRTSSWPSPRPWRWPRRPTSI